MKVIVAFQHIEHHPAADSHIREKSSKLEKLIDGKGEAQLEWHCSKRDGRYHVEAELLAAKTECHASADGSELRDAVSKAVAKLQRQLVKKKEVVKNKIHRDGEELVCRDPEMGWAEAESGPKKED